MKNDKTNIDRIAHTKRALIEALQKTLGVVTSACEAAGVSRSTFYNYYREDPEFQKSVDDLSDVALDFAESKLFSQIDQNNTAATIFYLKTKGKHRGYVERQEVDHSGELQVKQITGMEIK